MTQNKDSKCERCGSEEDFWDHVCSDYFQCPMSAKSFSGSVSEVTK